MSNLIDSYISINEVVKARGSVISFGEPADVAITDVGIYIERKDNTSTYNYLRIISFSDISSVSVFDNRDKTISCSIKGSGELFCIEFGRNAGMQKIFAKALIEGWKAKKV